MARPMYPDTSHFLDRTDLPYSVVLCDIWGVIHDGVRLLPGAAERLGVWRAEGRTVILISNAPRSAETVTRQLERLGLARHCWDAVTTSGEAAIAQLSRLGRPIGFLGTLDDRRDLEGRGLSFVNSGYSDIAVTGLDERRDRVEDYVEELARLAADNVVMHCINPDRLVIVGGIPEACAGALADFYEANGGAVEWYGKPHAAIYEHAMQLAGNPPPSQVLAVGDALLTDMLGAARQEFDALFVTSGIHAGETLPQGALAEFGFPHWSPVAVVDSLA